MRGTMADGTVLKHGLKPALSTFSKTAGRVSSGSRDSFKC